MAKTALVTGASSGIGKAAAQRLCEDGYTVYAAARRTDLLRPLADLGARPLFLDVTHEESLQNTVDQVIREQGQLDVLVNVAGYGVFGALEDVAMDEARRQFEVNLFSYIRLAQLVLPHMRRQGQGKIVNVSSVMGKVYLPMGGWYVATKHALEALSDVLRSEVRPFGVDVIIIEPGAVLTEFLELASAGVLSHSAETVYGNQAEAASRMLLNADKEPVAIRPEKVAATISKALQARKPKTRYLVGRMVRLPLFLVRVLPDRAIERMIHWQLVRMGLVDNEGPLRPT